VTGPDHEPEAGVLYAVCPRCAHVEPRPAQAAEDWAPCEACGQAAPDSYDDADLAEQASERHLRRPRDHDE
jgi:hypothetical protein